MEDMTLSDSNDFDCNMALVVDSNNIKTTDAYDEWWTYAHLVLVFPLGYDMEFFGPLQDQVEREEDAVEGTRWRALDIFMD
jgi:hypothetical protein